MSTEKKWKVNWGSKKQEPHGKLVINTTTLEQIMKAPESKFRGMSLDEAKALIMSGETGFILSDSLPSYLEK